MTSTLFYDDPDLLEFDATIVALETDEGCPAVVLDRSAFYPEGGGQPADHGWIAGAPVVHVTKQNERILHRLGVDLPADFAPGVAVRAVVDRARRRDYRQQHTGQHILSAALMQVGEYATVGVHQGNDYTTIEIDSATIPPDDLAAVERLANEAIEADLAVTTQWVTDSEIGRLPLRRPPKVSGSIRIVQVGDLDCVACGGVHVGRTGQIRLVRALAVETIRGHARIAWKIGDRAIDHYRECSEIVAKLAASMSAQPHELVDRADRQEQRMRELDAVIEKLQGRNQALIAERLLAATEPEGDGRLVTALFDGEPAGFLRGLTERLIEEPGVVACLASRTDGRLNWSVGIAPGSSVEFAPMREELLAVIDGKGGGRPPIWQGIGTRTESVEQFLDCFRRLSRGEQDRRSG